MPTTDPLLLAATALIGILGIARAVRLITSDTYPPALWLRFKWLDLTDQAEDSWRSGWTDLATCPFCAAPYVAAGSLVWWWFSDAHWTWWALHLWGAVAYVAAMVVARDEPCDC